MIFCPFHHLLLWAKYLSFCPVLMTYICRAYSRQPWILVQCRGSWAGQAIVIFKFYVQQKKFSAVQLLVKIRINFPQCTYVPAFSICTHYTIFRESWTLICSCLSSTSLQWTGSISTWSSLGSLSRAPGTLGQCASLDGPLATFSLSALSRYVCKVEPLYYGHPRDCIKCPDH